MNLLSSNYMGIEGVYCYDSGNPGPVVGIGCLTHGGEESGYRALNHIADYHILSSIITRGSFFAFVNNIDAYKAYLLDSAPYSIDKVKKYRYLDVDMNRLDLSHDGGSEFARLSAIGPIIAHCDFFLDLHTMYTKSIADNSVSILLPYSHIQSLPITTDEVIYGLIDATPGRPFISLVHDAGGVAYGLEGGYEGDPTIVQKLMDNCVEFLHYGMSYNLDVSIGGAAISTRYVVTDVIFSHQGYFADRQFVHGEYLPANTLVGYADGDPIYTPHAGYCLLPKHRVRADGVVMYLGNKI